MNGHCRFCSVAGEGILFSEWVKPTFTDFDKLQPGEIVCNACLFFFDESSVELQQITHKDKPQRMRNYSHFIIGGEWRPYSKGDKAAMRELLLGDSFPELAAIADSGQKHIVFRAFRNAVGSKSGWVQFEEQRVYVVPAELRALLEIIESLYATFSKGEIESGNYSGWRILEFGLAKWKRLEDKIKPLRGNALFSLALFLAQRSDDGRDAGTSGEPAEGDLARDTSGVQEQVSDDDLESVREPSPKRRVHKQSGKVRQPTLL